MFGWRLQESWYPLQYQLQSPPTYCTLTSTNLTMVYRELFPLSETSSIFFLPFSVSSMLFTCWNMIVCVAMGVAQLFLWARWAAVSRHPSNWKLWVVVIASGLAMLLEIYDFPPYGGYFDAHSIWHLATVPLTILWWSFIRDDAEFRTSSLLKKSKTKAK